MLRFTLLLFAAAWTLFLGIAFGLIPETSRFGYGPLVLFMFATMTGLSGIEDRENRAPLLLLSAASFGSCMLYAVFRYLLLFGWAGR
jgi:hypothetical protein